MVGYGQSVAANAASQRPAWVNPPEVWHPLLPYYSNHDHVEEAEGSPAGNQPPVPGLLPPIGLGSRTPEDSSPNQADLDSRAPRGLSPDDAVDIGALGEDSRSSPKAATVEVCNERGSVWFDSVIELTQLSGSPAFAPTQFSLPTTISSEDCYTLRNVPPGEYRLVWRAADTVAANLPGSYFENRQDHILVDHNYSFAVRGTRPTTLQISCGIGSSALSKPTYCSEQPRSTRSR